MNNFKVDHIILQRYASVLVNFALGSGEGVKRGQVVRLVVGESAKPLYVEIRNQIIRSGAHFISHFQPEGVAREIYELSSSEQLEFFPKKIMRSLVDEVDHQISIISEVDMHELEGVDPHKIMLKAKATKPFSEWRDKKENLGKFTWTLALFGTDAMAKEAGLSIDEYWQQIIKACFLDYEDPIAKWKDVHKINEDLRSQLNSMKIEKLHVVGEGVDLWVQIGEGRKWLGGSGRNIPSFEIFISPDWRGTNGYIEFNQPLYRYGSIIEGIKLEFENGRVAEFSASKNRDVLSAMLANDNADKIGEFSLTDKRVSRIDRFMANTLFDENISGEYGNTHIALGKAYKDSYPGELSNVSKKQWVELGYNDSVVHTDIVSTTRRTVTAFLSDGSERIIYIDGEFTI